MILSDLEWLSNIFADTKHRAASLRQQSFLLLTCMSLWCVVMQAVRLATTAWAASIDATVLMTLRATTCLALVLAPPDGWDATALNVSTRFNSLESRRNYRATSNNMKLVHWPLMGGLLYLVQRGGDWAGPQHAQAPPRCTKCNSPPINSQCTNHRITV